MENNLKVLFVKQDLDLTGPRQSYRWEEGIELNLLKQFKGKTSLWEMLCYFKCDFLIVPTTMAAPWLMEMINKPGYKENLKATTKDVIDPEIFDFSKYDLVITHDPFLHNYPSKFPNTIFAYIAAEHTSFDVHYYGVYYDLYLDHTLSMVDNFKRLPQAINFLFPRVPELIKKLFPQKNTNLFFDYRSIGHFISGKTNYAVSLEEKEKFYNVIKKFNLNLKVEEVSDLSLKPFMFDTKDNNDSTNYYSKLSRSKYFITIANRIGQAAFDASSAGALVIGNKLSKLHNLICHPFCLMHEDFTLQDVLNKINELENNKTLYEECWNHQQKFLYSYNIKRPLNLLLEAKKYKNGIFS